MKKKIIFTFFVILIIFGFFKVAPFVFGQNENIDSEIEILNQQITNQKKQIEALKNKQKEYEEQITRRQAS